LGGQFALNLSFRLVDILLQEELQALSFEGRLGEFLFFCALWRIFQVESHVQKRHLMNGLYFQQRFHRFYLLRQVYILIYRYKYQ